MDIAMYIYVLSRHWSIYCNHRYTYLPYKAMQPLHFILKVWQDVQQRKQLATAWAQRCQARQTGKFHLKLVQRAFFVILFSSPFISLSISLCHSLYVKNCLTNRQGRAWNLMIVGALRSQIVLAPHLFFIFILGVAQKNISWIGGCQKVRNSAKDFKFYPLPLSIMMTICIARRNSVPTVISISTEWERFV